MEDDVDVWRYAILELHVRNDDDDVFVYSVVARLRADCYSCRQTSNNRSNTSCRINTRCVVHGITPCCFFVSQHWMSLDGQETTPDVCRYISVVYIGTGTKLRCLVTTHKAVSNLPMDSILWIRTCDVWITSPTPDILSIAHHAMYAMQYYTRLNTVIWLNVIVAAYWVCGRYSPISCQRTLCAV